MKRTPRVIVRSDSIDGRIARLDGAELHHVRNVMRLRSGSEVAVLDDRGREYRGRITALGRSEAQIELRSAPSVQSGPRLILAAAMIRGPRMDFLVEKAAELGVTELRPLLTARGVARNPGEQRLARWRRLALAAAKQSLSPIAMAVSTPCAMRDLIASRPRDMFAIMCQAGAPPMNQVLRNSGKAGVLIAIGPEGDFETGEVESAQRSGFALAGLGSNRLRSETAAIAAVTLARAALEDFRTGGREGGA